MAGKPKFKVGDRVRFLPMEKRTPPGPREDREILKQNSYEAGKEFVIYWVSDDRINGSYYYTDLNGGDYYGGVYEHNLELVETAPELAETKEYDEPGIFIPLRMLPEIKNPNKVDDPRVATEYWMTDALYALALARYWNERIEE